MKFKSQTDNKRIKDIQTAANAAAVAAATAVIAAEKQWHNKSYIYPALAAAVTIPAHGDAWTMGAKTEVIPAGGITGNFDIHYVNVSAMSANASFHGTIYYGEADTEHCHFSVTRSGVQISTVIIPVTGGIIPANSRVRISIADSLGTSTLAVKLVYHLE